MSSNFVMQTWTELVSKGLVRAIPHPNLKECRHEREVKTIGPITIIAEVPELTIQVVVVNRFWGRRIPHQVLEVGSRASLIDRSVRGTSWPRLEDICLGSVTEGGPHSKGQSNHVHRQAPLRKAPPDKVEDITVVAREHVCCPKYGANSVNNHHPPSFISPLLDGWSVQAFWLSPTLISVFIRYGSASRRGCCVGGDWTLCFPPSVCCDHVRVPGVNECAQGNHPVAHHTPYEVPHISHAISKIKNWFLYRWLYSVFRPVITGGLKFIAYRHFHLF
jgi:hypothetical protein